MISANENPPKGRRQHPGGRLAHREREARRLPHGRRQGRAEPHPPDLRRELPRRERDRGGGGQGGGALLVHAGGDGGPGGRGDHLQGDTRHEAPPVQGEGEHRARPLQLPERLDPVADSLQDNQAQRQRAPRHGGEARREVHQDREDREQEPPVQHPRRGARRPGHDNHGEEGVGQVPPREDDGPRPGPAGRLLHSLRPQRRVRQHRDEGRRQQHGHREEDRRQEAGAQPEVLARGRWAPRHHLAPPALARHDGDLDQGVHPHLGGDGGEARAGHDLPRQLHPAVALQRVRPRRALLEVLHPLELWDILRGEGRATRTRGTTTPSRPSSRPTPTAAPSSSRSRGPRPSTGG